MFSVKIFLSGIMWKVYWSLPSISGLLQGSQSVLSIVLQKLNRWCNEILLHSKHLSEHVKAKFASGHCASEYPGAAKGITQFWFHIRNNALQVQSFSQPNPMSLHSWVLIFQPTEHTLCFSVLGKIMECNIKEIYSFDMCAGAGVFVSGCWY